MLFKERFRSWGSRIGGLFHKRRPPAIRPEIELTQEEKKEIVGKTVALLEKKEKLERVWLGGSLLQNVAASSQIVVVSKGLIDRGDISPAVIYGAIPIVFSSLVCVAVGLRVARVSKLISRFEEQVPDVMEQAGKKIGLTEKVKGMNDLPFQVLLGDYYSLIRKCEKNVGRTTIVTQIAALQKLDLEGKLTPDVLKKAGNTLGLEMEEMDFLIKSVWKFQTRYTPGIPAMDFRNSRRNTL